MRLGDRGEADGEVYREEEGGDRAMRKSFDLRLECHSKQGRMSFTLTLSVQCAHFSCVPGGRVD